LVLNPGFKPAIFIDCDGVLLDWITPFLTWKRNEIFYGDGYREGPVTYTPLPVSTSFDISKSLDWWEDSAHFVRDVIRFENTPGFGQLRALALIAKLEALRNSGFRLFVLTAGGGTIENRLKRVANLTYLFGNVFENIFFLGHKDSKADFIRSHQAACDDPSGLLIDDKLETLNEAADKGIPTIGIIHTWNRGPSKTSVKWEASINHAVDTLLAARYA
jgi:hypothetical protein